MGLGEESGLFRKISFKAPIITPPLLQTEEAFVRFSPVPFSCLESEKGTMQNLPDTPVEIRKKLHPQSAKEGGIQSLANVRPPFFSSNLSF